jgi:gas vesicle protein
VEKPRHGKRIGEDRMNLAGDGNMVYLLFGTLVGIVLGINIAVLYHRFIGNKARTETKLRAEIRELEKRLRQKDEYIAKAIKSVKDERRGS